MWISPEIEVLKFNIDGAVSGGFGLGLAGIGGVSRNYASKTLSYFSKNVGVIDVPTAILLAIKEASILFKSSKWTQSHRLFVECDSNNAVYWIKNIHLSPAPFKGIIEGIMATFEGLDRQVSLVSREQNTLADNVAKKKQIGCCILGVGSMPLLLHALPALSFASGFESFEGYACTHCFDGTNWRRAYWGFVVALVS
ncbi:hypothetical protein V6N11_047634 [Hibiscus sabdariffa]|uniref:RNase H type-1 domain-containing protein n=1 Tax=Hibiscus sabdariffa TaxID=183260 RepID=A0ABR2NL28_9ROSI